VRTEPFLCLFFMDQVPELHVVLEAQFVVFKVYKSATGELARAEKRRIVEQVQITGIDLQEGRLLEDTIATSDRGSGRKISSFRDMVIQFPKELSRCEPFAGAE
jgi:hypothetical protein